MKILKRITIYFDDGDQISINPNEIEKMVIVGEALQEAYHAVQAAKRISNIIIPE